MNKKIDGCLLIRPLVGWRVGYRRFTFYFRFFFLLF